MLLRTAPRPVERAFMASLSAAVRPWIDREARKAARIAAAEKMLERRRRESAAAAAALDLVEIECSALSLPDYSAHIGPALERCSACARRELDALDALDRARAS